MANWNSSVGALENLLIGLGRGYLKERKRLMRGKLLRSDGFAVDQKLRADLVTRLMTGLGDYFRDEDKSKIAEAVAHAMPYFQEQK